MDVNTIERMDILLVDLGWNKGSVQSGQRPVLVVSNNVGNRVSGILEVIPFTSKEKRAMCTHMWVEGFGLPSKSLLLAEQIITISKKQIIRPYGKITDEKIIREINKKIIVSLGLL